MDVTPVKLVQETNRCLLCGSEPPNNERVNIFGKSSLDIVKLINSALGTEITTDKYSSYKLFVCTKKCYKRVVRYKKCAASLETVRTEIAEEFQQKGQHRIKRLRREESDDRGAKSGRISKTLELDFPIAKQPSQAVCAYPVASPVVGCIPFDGLQGLASLPILTSTPKKRRETNGVSVSVVIEYPSKTVRHRLPEEYEGIGKALSYGQTESLAKAVTKCKPLMKNVLTSVLKILSSEVNDLCSRKNPSLLRKTSPEDLENFNLKLLCEEWKTRAPLFYSFLLTCSTASQKSDSLPGVAMAGSVLLKQRNRHMNATASVIGLMVKSGSLESALDRLSKLKVTCCNKVVLSKMDVLGRDFDQPLKSAKDLIVCESAKTKVLSQKLTEHEHSSEELKAAKEILRAHKQSCHEGFTIAFDNIDLLIHRRNMTAAKQNTDIHWTNHNMFVNRVSGNSLPIEAPRRELIDVPNMEFLPSAQDQVQQRHNYAVLVSRILVEHFQAYVPLADACIQHIPHQYTKEMSQKSIKVPLGVIFKNENVNEDMVGILQQLQSYIPQASEGGFDNQTVACDQLSLERAVNVMASVANGYTPEERLEGMNLQLADWHSGMKLLKVE